MFRGMGGRMEQGSIHTRQSMTVLRPAAVGAKLEVEIRVADKHQRSARRHVVLEITFSDDRGPVCTSTGTFLWGYAAT
jgi:acyl dehydratase